MAINSRIHILKYNTYFDRIYKKEENIAAYDQYLLYDKTNNPGIFNVDFKPNDGVAANQIINWNGDEPNYVVVTDYVDTENIISRWFVMECTRIRGGQYQLSLRRDVVADNIDAITASTAYINKAIVPDENPLIYNQEEITTNQIKSDEIPLIDDTGSAWIVGYIPADYKFTNPLSFKGASIFPDYNKDEWPYKDRINTDVYKENGYDFDVQIVVIEGLQAKDAIYRNYSRDNNLNFTEGRNYRADEYGFKKWLNENKSFFNDKIEIEANSLQPYAILDKSAYDNILKDKGKILYDTSTKKYYRIEIEYKTDSKDVYIRDYGPSSILYEELYDKFYNCPYRNTKYDAMPGLRLHYKYNVIVPKLVEIDTSNYSCTIPDSREHLKDAPYDMFAIPYADNISFVLSDATPTTININKTSALQIAQGLASVITKDVLLDLQLLPYCPFSGYSVSNNQITMPFKEGRTILVKNVANEAVSVLIFCTASSGTKNIILDKPLTFDNKKIENQCNFYRLVSPNYNGQFEFNLARNNVNNLNLFNVDYTYIPYNPYIHINPYFSGLYGTDYNDARGLICQGDFSIAYMSDRWAEYQVQNKNYQNIFNRETQNLEYNHKLDLGQNITKAVLGSFQGAASGMAMGSLGGGVGAAIGGIVGGVTSLAGGIADIGISEAKYGESMKYRKDIFNMQLDNIRALPNSIAKSTAFTYNNKIFPILEFYTCTDTEKQVVANLIANSSMKVGSIDTVSTYIGNTWSYGDIHSRGFLSCQIIKLGNLSLDTHMQYAIFDEMEKGIYFGG